MFGLGPTFKFSQKQNNNKLCPIVNPVTMGTLSFGKNPCLQISDVVHVCPEKPLITIMHKDFNITRLGIQTMTVPKCPN